MKMGWHTLWNIDVRRFDPKNLVDAANIVWREIPYRPYKGLSDREAYEARVGSPDLEVEVWGLPEREERDLYLRIPAKKRDYNSLKRFLEAMLTLEPKLTQKIVFESGFPIDKTGKYHIVDRYRRTVTITTSLTKLNKRETITKGVFRSGETVYDKSTTLPLGDVSKIVDELFYFPRAKENLSEQWVLAKKVTPEEFEKWQMEYEPESSTVSLETKQESRISNVHIEPITVLHRHDRFSIMLPAVTIKSYEEYKSDFENALNLISKVDMRTHWYDVWRVGSDDDTWGNWVEPIFLLIYYLGKPFEWLSRRKESTPETEEEEIPEEKEEAILVETK